MHKNFRNGTGSHFCLPEKFFALFWYEQGEWQAWTLDACYGDNIFLYCETDQSFSQCFYNVIDLVAALEETFTLNNDGTYLMKMLITLLRSNLVIIPTFEINGAKAFTFMFTLAQQRRIFSPAI